MGPYTLLRLERGGLDPGVPGQFFMLEAPGCLLPRPMSLCTAPAGELGFVVDPIGPGTRALCSLEPGDALRLFGPLGNGYRLDVERPLLVGGGIGVAPLPYLSEALGRPPALLGFRSEWHAEAAALVPNAEVAIEPTYVTDLLLARLGSGLAITQSSVRMQDLTPDITPDILTPDGPGGTRDAHRFDVLACGPEPMLEAVRRLCPRAQLAWEAPMACGYGACYGCAVEIGGELKRLCVEGPVLEAAA